MEPDQTDIELLDRYFRNELTSEELAVLQSKMKDVDFASAAKSHFEALSIIQSAGRIELMSSLTTIQKNVEQQNGFDKYKPTKSGKGSSGGSGGGNSMIIIAGVIAIVAYFYSTTKLDPSEVQSVFPDSEKVDTVYHYNVIRDTVYYNKKDTIETKVTRKVVSDTVFIRQKIRPPAQVPADSFTFSIQ